MNEEMDAYKAEQAHAYLDGIRKAGESCAGLVELVADARARAEGLGGVDYRAERVSGSPSAKDMADKVAEIRERGDAYLMALADYEERRHQANEALMRMEDATCEAALRRRYLLGWDWERVCVRMGYSYDGMMKLRRRALAEYWEVMPHTERDPIHRAV